MKSVNTKIFNSNLTTTLWLLVTPLSRSEKDLALFILNTVIHLNNSQCTTNIPVPLLTLPLSTFLLVLCYMLPLTLAFSIRLTPLLSTGSTTLKLAVFMNGYSTWTLIYCDGYSLDSHLLTLNDLVVWYSTGSCEGVLLSTWALDYHSPFLASSKLKFSNPDLGYHLFQLCEENDIEHPHFNYSEGIRENSCNSF